MNPIAILGLLFVVVPFVEIYFLIKVGSVIGAGWTIFLVIFTAVLGAALLRAQGLATLARAQESMQQGALPAMELVDGMFLLVGGALLLTPGFFTDAIGFVCLIPGLRRALFARMAQRFQARSSVIYTQTDRRTGHETHIIDGEYRRDE